MTFLLLLLSHFSRVWLCATLWTVARQVLLSMGFSGKNTGMGCHALLQGLFLTQEWNPYLMHWQAYSFPQSHQGRPERAWGLIGTLMVWTLAQSCWVIRIGIESKQHFHPVPRCCGCCCCEDHIWESLPIEHSQKSRSLSSSFPTKKWFIMIAPSFGCFPIPCHLHLNKSLLFKDYKP